MATKDYLLISIIIVINILCLFQKEWNNHKQRNINNNLDDWSANYNNGRQLYSFRLLSHSQHLISN